MRIQPTNTMEFKQFIANVRSGFALPLGFESANAPKPEFIQALLDAGENGLEISISPDSSFDVRTNMVKRAESSAFGKQVGNVAVRAIFGSIETNISVDLGTLAAFADGNGKTVLCAHQAKTSDGKPYTTTAGKPIYNFVAKKTPALVDQTLVKLETWVTTFQIKVPATA